MMELRRADAVRNPGAYWLRHHPDSVFASLRVAMDEERWTTALSRLRGELETHLENRHLDSVTYQRLSAELSLDGGLLRAATLTPKIRNMRAAAASRWHPVGNPVTGEYAVFNGPRPVALASAATVDRARAICWASLAAERVLTRFNTEARSTVEVELERIDDLWDGFADHSYAQLPWELALNAATSMRTGNLEPPGHQYILLHPEPAVDISGGKFPDWIRSDALSVPIFGVIWYNPNRSSFYGVSGGAVLSAKQPVGFNVTAMLGRGFSVGYVRRNPKNAVSKSGVIVSAEVYRFLSGIPELIGKRKEEALKQVMSK